MKVKCKWFCEEKEVYGLKISAYCFVTMKECNHNLACCGEIDKC